MRNGKTVDTARKGKRVLKRLDSVKIGNMVETWWRWVG